jgi:hypothetical protein
MPTEKVVAFVLGYTPDSPARLSKAARSPATSASLPASEPLAATFGRLIAEPGQCHQRGGHGERHRGPHHAPVRLNNRISGARMGKRDCLGNLSQQSGGDYSSTFGVQKKSERKPQATMRHDDPIWK